MTEIECEIQLRLLNRTIQEQKTIITKQNELIETLRYMLKKEKIKNKLKK